MRRLAGLLVFALGVAACSSDDSPSRSNGELVGGNTSSVEERSLSQDEVAMAVAVARDRLKNQGASVSSATAIMRPGRVVDTNTGHRCGSGRILRIKLIGSFPHIVTTGHPVLKGQPVPDFTVRALIITADASSGQVCLAGVQTAEAGEPQPLADATVLDLG